jgi:hypothetical protein
MDTAIGELAPVVSAAAACRAVGRPRATHYRHHRVSLRQGLCTDRRRRPSRSRAP